MNGKKGLENQDQAKGFVLFLLSERQRHIKDIRMIEDIVCEVCYNWGIRAEEVDKLRKEAKKYVEF